MNTHFTIMISSKSTPILSSLFTNNLYQNQNTDTSLNNVQCLYYGNYIFLIAVHPIKNQCLLYYLSCYQN